MKVRELMTRDVRSCSHRADLAAVAMQMWAGDCGVVPILDDQERLAGLITDRDICMAAATKHQRPDEIPASALLGRTTHFCAEEDDVQDALRLMAHQRVRRLPVLDDNMRLRGILSLNDVILSVTPRGTKADARAHMDAMETLRAISTHRFLLTPVTGAVPATAEAVVAASGHTL